MFHARASKVSKKLGHVFIGETFASFQFYDEYVINDKVGEEFTKDSSIFIAH